jgi:YVTN family beta-propeller protein
VEVFATNSLIAISSTTNSIVDNISLGSTGLPWNIIYDRVNRNLYLTNLNANSVTVINGTNDKIVTTIPVGQSPNDLAVDTAQGLNYGNVFVTNYASDSISVISRTTNAVLTNISVPTPKGIVVDQNSSNLLVANYGAGTV